MSEWVGSVAEPKVGGRTVDVRRVERDGETWLLLGAADGYLRIPEGLAGSLSTLLRAYANKERT